jgi:hypothetical protein
MREIVRTDDAVLVTFIETLLGEAGISVVVLDRNMAALYGGAVGLTQRLMVEEDDWGTARRLLDEAGLGQWIVEAGGP